jgi:hypothetical protein
MSDNDRFGTKDHWVQISLTHIDDTYVKFRIEEQGPGFRRADGVFIRVNSSHIYFMSSGCPALDGDCIYVRGESNSGDFNEMMCGVKQFDEQYLPAFDSLNMLSGKQTIIKKPDPVKPIYSAPKVSPAWYSTISSSSTTTNDATW